MLDSDRLIAYQAGWGDGAYPTRIGRDENGEVVCFRHDTINFACALTSADRLGADALQSRAPKDGYGA